MGSTSLATKEKMNFKQAGIISAVIILLVSINCNRITLTKNELICYYAGKYDQEIALIKSFRYVESRDGKKIYRNEKRILKNKDWVTNYIKKYKLDKYGDLIYYSLGDWQVLYLTAHWHGYRGEPEGLCVFETNLKYFCENISYYSKRYSKIQSLISAYNKGNATRQTNGLYSNQEYVNQVYKRYIMNGGIR